MVNYGTSRACATCKQRRKKCDESRPSCNRCIKSKLRCPGYQDEADLVFRNHSRKNTKYSPPKHALQLFEPQVYSFLTPRIQPSTSNKSDIRERVLADFLDDYCIVSRNKSLSRGYLDNLRSLLANAGPSSDITKAAMVAGLASIGNKLGEPDLVHEANILYSDLLGSFQVTMSRGATSNTIESLTTAVLLGLYEIISASVNHPGEHGTHFRGVTAILSNENSPFNRQPAKEIIQVTDFPLRSTACEGPLMWPHNLSILCPSRAASAPNLDILLLRFSSIFRQNEILTFDTSISPDEIRQFREFAVSLDEELAMWPANQPKEWMPNTIGFVSHRRSERPVRGTAARPSRVDTYFDLYVSSVWNCYRKCRLILLDFIYTCSTRLNNEETEVPSQSHILKEASELSESLAASIPFHLTQNPEAYIDHQRIDSPKQILLSNKSIGGLLIIHPLHALLGLSVVPLHLREQFREHLVWIGDVMGIGQASLLADHSTSFPREYFVNGHVLIWAGALASQTGQEHHRQGKEEMR